MQQGHNPKLRFGLSLDKAARPAVRASIRNAPDLPAVSYQLVGQTAPTLLTTPAVKLPKASAIVITWAEAEWAVLEHVFCSGSTPMPYSDRNRGTWPDWQEDSSELRAGGPSGWTSWGSYRLVQIGAEPVLLYKSNTHLDWPGAPFLEALIERFVNEVQPKLILSIGTAGGAKPADRIGTVRAVSAGTLFDASKPPGQWPAYSNTWKAKDTVLNHARFSRLLLPVPSNVSDLEALCEQFNTQYKTAYTLEQLDPKNLNLGDPSPLIEDQTGGAASLLTTSTFVVGTTAGTYSEFVAIEMDDAVIGEACRKSGTAFAFVRNISDPVQNAALPATVQGNWGSAIYDAYGFYTSYNGAIAAWAMLAAGI